MYKFSSAHIYSDGSTNQNRHSTFSKALLQFAIIHNVEVEQDIEEKERATHKSRLTLFMVVLKGI